MTLARTGAARLRGVFVGASAGAVAVAAHGVGGTALPASPSIVLMVLLCAVVGAVASSPAEIHRRPPVVRVYVLAAQLVGHCTWVFASTHTHANHWSVQMVASHVVAAFICAAALICTAERLFGALAGVLWHLILVLLAPRDDDHPPQSYRAWAHTGLTSRDNRAIRLRRHPVRRTARPLCCGDPVVATGRRGTGGISAPDNRGPAARCRTHRLDADHIQRCAPWGCCPWTEVSPGARGP